MAHYSRVTKIVIDVPPGEHDRELAFWNAATGQQMKHFERFPEYHGTDHPARALAVGSPSAPDDDRPVRRG